MYEVHCVFVPNYQRNSDADNLADGLSSRWKLLARYLRKHRRTLTVGILSMVARDSMSFCIPLLIRAGVNALTEPHPELPISAVGLLMIAVAAPRGLLLTVARLSLMSTSREVEYEMRRDLLVHLFRLDSAFWGRTRVGDIMACATNDLNAVRMMLGPGVALLFESLIALPVAFIVMASIDWKLALLAFAPAPAAVWIMWRFGQIIRVRFDRIQAMFSAMSASVQQTIAGVRLVRAFVRESHELARFERLNQSYVRANSILAMYSGSLDPLLSFVTGAAVLTVLFYGGHQVLMSKLPVGSFVLFTTYVAMLIRPISSLGRVVNLMQRGSASVGRLKRIFDQQPGIVSPAHQSRLPGPRALQSGIIFDRVGVRYGDVHALRDVELAVPSGSTVAILGRTGSGKSTAVRLLPRLIDPTSGRLVVDGCDARALQLNDLRSLIGMVPQETFLFSATLAENIAFGVPSASRADIERASEIAGLISDLAVFPKGFDTVVGERGVMVSGGQKQRVAVARAVLRDARILILDDALSSVDADTERRILGHLRTVMVERTTFIITHRISTAQMADHIVVLKGGQIAEQGCHKDLLSSSGEYTRMHDIQTLEEELENM